MADPDTIWGGEQGQSKDVCIRRKPSAQRGRRGFGSVG